MRINIGITLFFFISSSALGQSRSAIIVGHPTYLAHKRAAEFAYKGSKNLGLLTYIASGKKWDFISPSDFGTVGSTDEIEKLITRTSKDMAPGDKFNLFIYGHGGPPENQSAPGSGSVLLTSKRSRFLWTKISLEKIGEMLRQHIPESNSVHIVSTVCFSGGFHEISFQSPNTCSLSATDFRSPSYVTDQGLNRGANDPFANSLWLESKNKKFDLDADGKTSLFEGFLAALTYDNSANYGRGGLSSEFYIDKYFSGGAYGPENTRYFLNGLRKTRDPVKAALTEAAAAGNCNYPSGSRSIDKVKELANLLVQLAGEEDTDISGISGIPKVFKDAVEKARVDGNSTFQQQTQRYADLYAELKAEWSALNPSERNRQLAVYTEKFANLRQEAETANNLNKYFTTYRLLKFAGKIKKFFNETEDSNKKQKLIDLLNCENEALQ